MFAVPRCRRLMVLIAVMAWLSACGGSASNPVAETPEPQDRAEPAPTIADDDAATAADTVVADESAAEPVSTVEPVRSRGQQSTPEQSKVASIRDIDFRDGFAYELDGRGPGSLTVVDGEYANGEFGDADYFWFGVTDVEIGDLDGDGSDEAVVSTSWNGGGSGYFDSVTAYRLVDGYVDQAGKVLFGDRAHGGIHDMRIEGGHLSVWSYSTTLGACCPNQIARSTLVLGEHSLVVAEQTPFRTWLEINDYTDDPELKFLPDTSSAVAAVYGYTTEGIFTFEGGQGQRLTVALTSGPAPGDITVTDLTTGETVSGLADMELASSGFYEVRVRFDAQRDHTTTLDVIIDAEDSGSTVTWTPAVEQVLVDEDPYVATSLVWPEFVSEQPGTAAANQALAEFVTQLDDYWIEDVTVHSDPLDHSTYELDYTVTLATQDLVSVRFDFLDYVCCRPYPNYGPTSAVLDMAAGRLLSVEEILNLDRLDEITELWLAELRAQEVIPEAVRLVGERPAFDSVSLTAEGVEFGTERNSLGGGIPGTLVVVAYGDLAGLIQPDLLARVQAG